MPHNYAKIMSAKQTPQSEPIPNSTQVANSAGGYAWAVDDWALLDRFLVLGAEGATYYASAQKLQKENAQGVLRCVAADGLRTVAQIVAISDSGRAPKNSPAIFALALAAKHGDQATRTAAYNAMPKVCRIGTHLFEFWHYANELGGSSMGLRRAVKRWYLERPAESLGYQLLKYQSRDNWSHRDLLRLARPKATGLYNDLFHWAVKGWPEVGETPHPEAALRQIWAFERLKLATKKATVINLIRDYDLPREAVTSEWLKEPDVWAALLDKMPITAMVRNLGTMSKIGLLKPMSEAERTVIDRLGDMAHIKRARLHPIALLSALKVYEQGHGERSSATWIPCAQVVDALDKAFYSAFQTIEPSGKRTLLAIDISGSMDGGVIAGIPGLTPRVAAGAMALVTANVEAQWAAVGFTAGNKPTWSPSNRRTLPSGLSPLTISPCQRLDDVIRYMQSLQMGGTDCAVPMLWATQQKAEIDTFILYTDSETWAGDIHPVQALRQYRDRMGIAAKLIVVGMVSNGFTIADPNDNGMLDCVGMDTATPSLISDFAR